MLVVEARKEHQWQSKQRTGMKKFWLAKGDLYSLSKHLQDHHKNECTKPTDAVPEDSPAAAEAMKAYRKLTSGPGHPNNFGGLGQHFQLGAPQIKTTPPPPTKIAYYNM